MLAVPCSSTPAVAKKVLSGGAVALAGGLAATRPPATVTSVTRHVPIRIRASFRRQEIGFPQCVAR
ncbi:hypothetical protein [Fodinicola feengrottensis]|uniref:hypothetical protein n=1 Tax=Fodinicola feengrottensis TaxID=435914 RepID=UPI0013D5FA73|nr:hypothetical protein [Fodinicola feengrottensis]